MSDTPSVPSAPTGRPRKADGPRVNYSEVDKALVFGEVTECADGETSDVRYPSYREIAARYGVSHSLIAQYSKRHDCLRRRESARVRITARAEQKLVELRASAMAYSRDDELRLIDTFLLGFEKALAEGRVRYDDPSDFNLMVRLKTFIQGGADSRQEVRAALSLEELQSRHRELLRRTAEATPALAGLADKSRRAPRARAGDQARDENSPIPPSADRPEEVTGHPDDEAEA
jgi:hypothetical protein